MFNFFKKSAKQSNEAWKGGAVVSGFDIHLGFVSISIEPADNKDTSSLSSSSSPVAVPNSLSKNTSPRRELNFKIEQDTSDNLVKDHEVLIDYFFNTPDRFDYDLPHFPEDGWRKLEGNIQLSPNELVWIIGRFQNTSGKLLYQVPVSLKEIAVINNASGFRTDSHIHEIPNITKGIVVKTWNADDSVIYLHCFCQVPSAFDAKGNFFFLPCQVDSQKVLREQFKMEILEELFTRRYEMAALNTVKQYYKYYNTRDFTSIRKMLLSSKHLVNIFDLLPKLSR